MTRWSHLYPDWNNSDDAGLLPRADDAIGDGSDGGSPDEDELDGAVGDLLDDLEDAGQDEEEDD